VNAVADVAGSVLHILLHLAQLVEFHLAADFGLDVVDVRWARPNRVPAMRATLGRRSGPITTSATTPIKASLVRPISIMSLCGH
jgi:hypothetical protein